MSSFENGNSSSSNRPGLNCRLSTSNDYLPIRRRLNMALGLPAFTTKTTLLKELNKLYKENPFEFNRTTAKILRDFGYCVVYHIEGFITDIYVTDANLEEL